MALLPLTSQFWLLLVIFIPVGFISSSNGTQFSPESLFSALNSKTKQKQQNPDVSLWKPDLYIEQVEFNPGPDI